jgi:23S rRNA (pseudouridine1915-N3)-methyltransferase
MRIRFIWPGKTRDEHLRALVNEYLKRLSRFARCQVVEVRENVASDRGRVEKTARRILQAIPEASRVVLLDLNGRELSSEDLAKQIARWENDSIKELTIVIGGPDGLGAEVAARAKEKWRLSRLTLTHEMARVVVVEQLYRAYTINHGLPYQR